MTTQISNQFTKEAVKARIINNAVALWGVKNSLALDPFVRMLIEAFSIEVSKAANEARMVEGRILDKIARLMTPHYIGNATCRLRCYALLSCRVNPCAEPAFSFLYRETPGKFIKWYAD